MVPERKSGPTAAAGALLCALLLSGVLAACGSTVNTSSQSAAAAPTATAPPTTTAAPSTTAAVSSRPPSISVTEQNFKILPASPQARAGLVDFAVNDNGPDAHEFLIFQSDLAPDKFPMKDGRGD